ncbi:unnamed protein product [Ceratitis capitata]|uniref:(Mediterranean fruit fly) hypothetical protein n=1 Tax=Ceratitis capitata TaxID=7213 RepID=A0A811V237_CERCA|nr:unnamed protein product [Ceratitis capitata]
MNLQQAACGTEEFRCFQIHISKPLLLCLSKSTAPHETHDPKTSIVMENQRIVAVKFVKPLNSEY